HGLATDVERHLSKLPVAARPPSRLYRFQKFVLRNKGLLGAAAVVVLALLTGVIVSTREAVRARRAESKSEQVAQFLKHMLEAAGPSKALGRDTAMLKDILDQTEERVGKELASQTAVQAELLNTLGPVYRELGDSSRAVAVHRQALLMNRGLYGPQHIEVAMT